MAYHCKSWPLIGRKSAHGQFEIFNTVTLIGSLLVSQGQKSANNMWPLKTITRRHGEAFQPSTEGSGGEAGQPSTKGRGVEKVKAVGCGSYSDHRRRRCRCL